MFFKGFENLRFFLAFTNDKYYILTNVFSKHFQFNMHKWSWKNFIKLIRHSSEEVGYWRFLTWYRFISHKASRLIKNSSLKYLQLRNLCNNKGCEKRKFELQSFLIYFKIFYLQYNLHNMHIFLLIWIFLNLFFKLFIKMHSTLQNTLQNTLRT